MAERTAVSTLSVMPADSALVPVVSTRFSVVLVDTVEQRAPERECIEVEATQQQPERGLVEGRRLWQMQEDDWFMLLDLVDRVPSGVPTTPVSGMKSFHQALLLVLCLNYWYFMD